MARCHFRHRRQSYSLKSHPAIFEARRRQLYLRHGGHAVYFLENCKSDDM
jgi:hypothetical protein